MKRCIDDLGGRGETVTGIVGSGSSNNLHQNQSGSISSFVRGPIGGPVNSVIPRSGATPLPGVVPIPVTSVGPLSIPGGPVPHELQSHTSTGYVAGKVEMHASLHPVPSPAVYSATVPSINPMIGVNAQSPAVAVATACVGSGQGSGQFQRLKVEDALSYLDQVKLQFGKEPQVYNDFLDIMKEFKSQSIDTPGVIARVSQLFRGHPQLIVGFNTFLPPGYKIEVSVTVPGQQTTVVHTPQGTHHHITNTQPPPQIPQAVPVKPAHINAPQTRPALPNTIGSGGSHSLHPVVCTVPQAVTPIGVTTTIVPTAPSHTTAVQVGNITSSGSVSATPVTVSIGSTVTPVPEQHSTNTAPQHGVSKTPIQQVLHSQPSHQQQPVEFNHAINYVNKIKHRFQSQPDTYKQFLEILHTYQKEQRHIKEGGTLPPRTLTETEVYEKVAKLFENQDDLLQEFGQFLPDATNNSAAQAAVSNFMDQYRSNNANTKVASEPVVPIKKPTIKTPTHLPINNTLVSPPTTNSVPPKPTNVYSHPLKRPHIPPVIASPMQPPTKKPKLGFLKDMSAAEAGKLGTLAEYQFFDNVRKALRHEETYYNFLRCITLYNEEILSRAELVQLINPFLSKFPDLLKWFKDFVGFKDGSHSVPDLIPSNVAKQERLTGDLAMEIDYTTCKRLGASYCALPKTFIQPRCSGRNSLCREVLNDTWVSFPSWSEDSTFVTSRKTSYEEYIYRCEDERFELDVVLETNLATIRVLEGVLKKIQRMNPDDAVKFRLDDCLGGSSPTIHQRAVRRIYGERAADIIDGLKKNPMVAVPLVLRRLKAKDDEWRDAQKVFNKVWREQNEKYYLKSLDHQGINFKQNDIKTIRSKTLLNDIETLFDERHEQAEEGVDLTGPHMVLHYKDKTILDDAAHLVIHHVKRQTTIHKDDKAKIKQLVRHFIPDLFFHPRQELSDDEKDLEDDDDDLDDEDDDATSESNKTESRNTRDRDCKQNSNGNSVNSSNNNQNSSSSGTSNSSSNSNNNSGTNGSNKRKTRSRADSDSDENKVNNNNNNSDSQNQPDSVLTNIKEENKSAVVTNGDISDDERFSIKMEVEDIKPDIKEEPTPVDDISSSYPDDEYRLLMGNNNWYLFLRLHQILCSRLTTMYEYAVKIASLEAQDKKDRKDSTAIALKLKPKNDIPVEEFYPALLDMIKNVLDGNLDSTAYEDTLREMFGIHAFIAFTLDKVVNGAVRQLQHLIVDEIPSQCTTLYLQESRHGGAGGPVASAHRRALSQQNYQKNAEKILQDENCFKIITYKKECKMSVELLDTELDDLEENNINNNNINGTSANHATIAPFADVERWSEYVEKYVCSVAPEISSNMQDILSQKPIFLPRNLRSWGNFPSMIKPQKHIEVDKSCNNRMAKMQESLEVDENTQCKFNLNNFKMVFIVNSDSYMYKKQALKRAKQSHKAVSLRMHDGLVKWHSVWCQRHITEADEKLTMDWFMGKTDGLIANTTRLVTINNTNKAPFTTYHKYKVEVNNTSTS